MKIFLTSAGFANKVLGEAFVKELSKQAAHPHVLLVTYAQNEDEQFYVNESIKELENLGVRYITTFNLNTPMDIKLLPSFDAIYVCGGNTFAILKKLKETGLDKFIISQVKNRSIYVGVSAGSIIAGPDIKIAGHGSEGDPNDVKLVDLNGFKLTDKIIFPHFREPLRGEVVSFQKLVKQEVVPLTNEQALIIIDDKVRLVE